MARNELRPYIPQVPEADHSVEDCFHASGPTAVVATDRAVDALELIEAVSESHAGSYSVSRSELSL